MERMRERRRIVRTNVNGVRAENVGFAGLLEAESHILRKLTTYGDHDTARVFELVDVHYPLVAELFKIQLVSSIEVSRVPVTC